MQLEHQAGVSTYFLCNYFCFVSMCNLVGSRCTFLVSRNQDENELAVGPMPPSCILVATCILATLGTSWMTIRQLHPGCNANCILVATGAPTGCTLVATGSCISCNPVANQVVLHSGRNWWMHQVSNGVPVATTLQPSLFVIVPIAS
jgi:hypothetical protein